MLSLNAARSWSIRPSEYLGLPPSRERDRGLMEGLLLLERHITETGYPDWLTTGMDAVGRFRVETRMDYALEQYERAHREAYAKGSEPPPGQRMFVRIDG